MINLAPVGSEDEETTQLRLAYEHLQSVERNCSEGLAQLDQMNLGLVRAHLQVSADYARKAKEAISEVGKKRRASQAKVGRKP